MQFKSFLSKSKSYWLGLPNKGAVLSVLSITRSRRLMAAHLNAHKPATASRWVVAPTRLANETAIHFHAHAADAHHLKRALDAADISTHLKICPMAPALLARAGCDRLDCYGMRNRA